MNTTVKALLLILQILCTMVVLSFFLYQGLLVTPSTAELGATLLADENLRALLPIVIHSLGLVIFSVFFFIVFGKATYPEISFIMLACTSYLVWDLRLLIPSLPFRLLEHQLFLTKVSVAFWFLSSAFIFCSGLFHNGIPYLKQQLFMIISTCTAILLVMITPFPLAESALALPIPRGILLFIRLLQISAILNYITAAVRNNQQEFLMISLGILLYIVGNELFAYQISLLMIIGAMVALVLSGIILIRKFYLLHLWS